MRPFSIAAFSALALLAPALASAQLRADLSVGFASISDSFDNKGERKDFKDPGPETDGATQATEDFVVPINIGLKYGFFRGLYAGAELSVLSISSEDKDARTRRARSAYASLTSRSAGAATSPSSTSASRPASRSTWAKSRRT